MAKFHPTSKHVQIDKAQATIVGIVAATVFVTVFSLVSVKGLLAQRSYQGRVIAQKKEAKTKLEANVEAVDTLISSYKEFTSRPENILGGNPAGTGDRDGDNARLVLDALPSKYDFPALTATLEKILTERQIGIDGISGTDDEVSQSAAEASGEPKPVEIPFQLAVKGNYVSIQDLISVFEHSIRPFQLTALSLSGGAGDMTVNIDAKTYFQPEKALDIKTEVVK